MSARTDLAWPLALLISPLLSCGTTKGARTQGSASSALAAKTGGNAPGWLQKGTSTDKVCAVGIAGRTHKMAQHKAKELSRERAVRNLAGVFETMIQEAQIEKASTHGDEMEYARSVQVSEEMVERVDQAAKSEYWVDDQGVGPFSERGFTYANVCVKANFLKEAKIPRKALLERADAVRLVRNEPPPWLQWVGATQGARLCATGFSLPALHPDATFENVVEDVRSQLVKNAKSLVMSVSEEFSVCRVGGDRCEEVINIVNMATTEAVSQGVLVNHFWYDRNGVGPNKKKRSTYGWGCVFPVSSLQAAVAKAKEKVPELDVPTVDRVKMRASDFFDELEREEAKAEAKAEAQAQR